MKQDEELIERTISVELREAANLLELSGDLDLRDACREAAGRLEEPAAIVRRIYVRWANDGIHIRKWAHEPFDHGEPVDAAFSDEGSGIGELREAIDDLDLLTDALLAGKTLSTEERRRAKAAVLALKAPDIDRSGLAQEVD